MLPILGEGNCLFRAAAAQTPEGAAGHGALRLRCVAWTTRRTASCRWATRSLVACCLFVYNWKRSMSAGRTTAPWCHCQWAPQPLQTKWPTSIFQASASPRNPIKELPEPQDALHVCTRLLLCSRLHKTLVRGLGKAAQMHQRTQQVQKAAPLLPAHRKLPHKVSSVGSRSQRDWGL